MIMGKRELEITCVSAANLPSVRRWWWVSMQVYAVVSHNGVRFTTKVDDTDNGKNPRWREKMVFLIDEACVMKAGTHVVVQLYCNRKWSPDKAVGGDVEIEVKSLYDSEVKGKHRFTSPVPRAGGGTLIISYAFGPLLAPLLSPTTPDQRRRHSIWNKIFGCGLTVCFSALAS